MTFAKLFIVVPAVALASVAWAQDAGVDAPATEVAPIEAARVEAAPGPASAPVSKDLFEVLATEVRRLKEELALPAPTYQSYGGLGPAASKVYFTPKGLSLGGYGEAFYRARPAAQFSADSDLLRVVLYAGYRFSDRVVFNSEIEFEHGSTARGGSVSVEFAYLDFKLFDSLSLRAGNVLIPMGFVNEIHEPPFFFGVQRPLLERNVIPATWNENGIGLYGELKGFRYRAYLVNGMRATASGGGFSNSTWVRGGRQGGAGAISTDLAGVAAVDYSFDPVRVGVSAYFGHSGQGAEVAGSRFKGQLFLGEAHAAVQWKGLWVRGILVYGRLGDAALISQAAGVTVGQEVLGGYGEVAYDVLGKLAPDLDQSLSPFVRYENFDTHKSVAAGLSRDAAMARHVVTAGLHYRPLANVAIKADYQQLFAGSTSNGTVSVGLGFVF